MCKLALRETRHISKDGSLEEEMTFTDHYLQIILPKRGDIDVHNIFVDALRTSTAAGDVEGHVTRGPGIWRIYCKLIPVLTGRYILGRLDQPVVHLRNLSKQVNNLSKQVQNLSEQVNNLSKQVQILSKQLSNLFKQVHNLSKQVHNLSKQVHNLSKQVHTA